MNEHEVPTRRPGQTTLWAQVLAAGDPKALGALLEQHWAPVYHFYRHLGLAPEEAADLTQGFFAHVLESGTLRAADPARGRFRAFLKTAARNFFLHEREKALAAKRGGGARRLDFATAERNLEAGDPPDRAFDRQWALEILQDALRTLEKELDGPLFEALRQAFSLDGPPESPTQARVARELGVSGQDVANFLFRARRRLRDILVERVAASVATHEEMDDEIRDLFEALRS